MDGIKQKASLEDLLTAYSRGDIASFNEFFARTRGVIYGYLKRRAPTGPAVDDIFQETYFRVHRYIASFNPSGNAMAWILKIAHSCLMNHFRKGYHKGEVALDTHDAASTGASQEDVLVLREILREAASVISPDEMALIIERFVDGGSYDDIAKARSWSSDNARQRISRVLKKIRASSSH